MALNTLFHKAARLGPFSIGAIAIAVLALGYYLQLADNTRGAGTEIAGMTIFGLLSKIACGIGLIGLAKFVLNSGGAQESAAPSETTAMPPEIPAMPQVIEVEGELLDPEKPSGNRASFLARSQKIAQATPAAPAPTTAYDDDIDDLDAPTQRRGFGLRKLLICLIGGAFAVMLASVVWDMLQETGEISPQAAVQASIPTTQERAAHSLADTLVPDADPNRRWTDIDVTPIVEWFTAKGLLAMSGDRDAQILLGMMIGGLLFVLFLLKFYFRLKRAMQPKTSANIGSMGIN